MHHVTQKESALPVCSDMAESAKSGAEAPTVLYIKAAAAQIKQERCTDKANPTYSITFVTVFIMGHVSSTVTTFSTEERFK